MKTYSGILHKAFLVGFCFFIFIIYRMTASPTISWVDSGVIAAAANTLGIANPPGFPSYMMIAHLFTNIPWGSVVSRLQLLSELSAVGMVMVVYWVVSKCGSCPAFSPKNTREGTPSWGSPYAGHPLYFSWPAAFAAIALAFSYGLWQQANNVETYTLTNFALFALVAWAIQLHTTNLTNTTNQPIHSKKLGLKKVSFGVWQIPLFGLTAGLAMGLNPTIAVLAAAGVVWMIWNWQMVKQHPGVFLGALGLFFIGAIAVYSYLPVRAAAHPFVDWGDPVNWERIRAHLFGAGLNIYEPETNSINGFTGQPVIFWESFLHFWHLAFFQFTPILFPLVILGAWATLRKNLFLFTILAALALSNMLFVVLYYGGNQESWMITSWVVFAVWMGMGVETISNFKFQISNIWIKRIIIIAGSLLPLAFWYPILNHSTMTYADDYAANLYKNVAVGSIIVGGGDFFNSLTAYTHEVTGFRKDVIPVTGNMFYIFDWYRKNLTLNTDITISASTSGLIKYKSVDEFTDAVDSLVADNPTKQVFVTPLLLRDSVVAGTRDGNYHTKKYDLIPHGLLLKVVPKGLPIPPDETILRGVTFGKVPYYLERNYKNAYRLLRNDYASSYQLLGNYWQERGDTQKAFTAFERSIELGPPDSPEYVHRLAIFYAQTGQNQAANTTFEKAISLAPDDLTIKQNYQTFVGSTASPSAALAGETLAFKGQGFSFSYPKDWKAIGNGQEVILTSPDASFRLTIRKTIRSAKTSVEEFINKESALPGTLVNQGLAKIPSFDVAYVRIWQNNTTNTTNPTNTTNNTNTAFISMQFFLFKSDAVIIVTAAPGDSPLMRTFDGVVTSLVVE